MPTLENFSIGPKQDHGAAILARSGRLACAASFVGVEYGGGFSASTDVRRAEGGWIVAST